MIRRGKPIADAKITRNGKVPKIAYAAAVGRLVDRFAVA
jgi:hypothetical protein